MIANLAQLVRQVQQSTGDYTSLQLALLARQLIDRDGNVKLNADDLAATLANLGGVAVGDAMYIAKLRNFAVRTTGSPGDTQIVLPSWLTRYKPVGNSNTGSPFLLLIQESGGDISAATFSARDTAGGAGLLLSGTSMFAPGGVGLSLGLVAASNVVSTTGNLFLRQGIDAANAGTLSAYMVLQPMI